MADVGISVELLGIRGVADSLKVLNDKVDDLGKSGKRASSSLESGLIPSMRSLKAAIAGVGAFQIVSYISKLEDGMEKSARAAQRLGISFEKLQGLELIAKRSGVAIETVAQSLTFLSKSVGESLSQPLSRQSRIFNALGVDAKFLKENANDLDAVLRKTLTGVSQLGSTTEKTTAIQALFGDQAVALFGQFNDGNKTIDQMIQGFRDMGLIIDNRASPTIRDLNSAFLDVTDQAETFIKKVLVGGMMAADDFTSAIARAQVGLKIFANQNKGSLGGALADILNGEDIVDLSGPRKPRAPSLAGGGGTTSNLPRARTIAGAMDQTGIAEAAKTAQVLAQLKIQYEQVADGVKGFNVATFESAALLRLGKTATAAQKQTVHEYALMIEDATAENESLALSVAATNRQMAFAQGIFEATRTPLEQYTQAMTELQASFDRGDLGANGPEIMARGIEALNAKLAGTSTVANDFGSALNQGLEDAVFSGQKLWKVLQNMERELAKSIFKNLFSDRVTSSLSRSLGKALGGDQLERGLDRVFDKFLGGVGTVFDAVFAPFLDGLTVLFEGAWKILSDTFSPFLEGMGSLLWDFLGEMGIMHALHEAGLWAVSLWDVAEKWAIAIFSAATGLLGFAGGGDMTVTRPTLIMVGERGAERVRVSPLAGRNARGGSPGDGGMIGGGGAAINVFLPQSSVVSNITAGNFARQISRTVNRENGRQV